MHTELFTEFAVLTERRQELEAEVDKLIKRLQELDALVRDEFSLNGVTKIEVALPGTDQKRTLSTRRDIYASRAEGCERADIIEALKQSDLVHYVHENYNDSSLAALVREIAQGIEQQMKGTGVAPDESQIREALPKPLRDVLKVGFKYSVRSNRSGSGGKTEWQTS